MVKNHSAIATIDLMTASLNLDLRLSDNLSLFLSGRGTTRDISNTQFNGLSNSQQDEETAVESFSEPIDNFRSDPNFNFFDSNFKLLWKPSKNSSLSLNAFASRDEYSNVFDSKIKESNGNKEFRLEATEMEIWENQSSSLQYNQKFKVD